MKLNILSDPPISLIGLAGRLKPCKERSEMKAVQVAQDFTVFGEADPVTKIATMQRGVQGDYLLEKDGEFSVVEQTAFPLLYEFMDK